MTLRELITYLDKPVVSGSLDTNIGMLAYDSRKVAPGTAFVALRGTHSDGHDFITKAIASGAAAIIAEQAPPDDVKVPWVHVKQTRIALAQAAAAMHGFPSQTHVHPCRHRHEWKDHHSLSHASLDESWAEALRSAWHGDL
jgi:UDP-N-acetylmuramoyl-L-alanyl-D-glutamate--2,6-diaminopimelate ligase